MRPREPGPLGGETPDLPAEVRRELRSLPASTARWSASRETPSARAEAGRVRRLCETARSSDDQSGAAQPECEDLISGYA